MPSAKVAAANETGALGAVSTRVDIPGYEIQRRIGEGASAVVHEAIELRSRRVVALKILRDELLTDPAARSRFHREARALMCVAHPNVAAVYDYSGPEAERVFIAMELYEGKSLRALIEERGRIPDVAAAAIFVQVFAALEAAHAEGLLHRDLSASNVVITIDGRAIVTDFGLVASVSGVRTGETFATRAANLVGTPLYYAPELLLSGQYSQVTDLYAAGVCLTFSLLGHPPAETKDMAKLLAAVIDGKLERVINSGATVDMPIAELADALTDPNVRKRPVRASDALAQLRTWLRARSIIAEDALAEWLEPSTEQMLGEQTQSITDELDGIRVASRGRFQVEQLIGQGGMARVFLGRDNRLNRAVAIKLMHDDDEVARKRFHREARALARVRHPNVMEVIDYSGPAAKLPYIVLELVDGSTLERVALVKPMDEVTVLCVAVAVCDGLQAVHQEGFIHRDVKPENIFIDRLGRVLLADFGIVRSARADTTGTFVSRNTAAVGSPLYASPEQIFEPDSAGAASDLFSLASLMFFLLMRKAPVSDTGVSEALFDLRTANMRKLAMTVSKDVRTLVASMHQLEPRKRPGSAGEVGAQLRAMLAVRKVVDPRAELRKFLGVDMAGLTSAGDSVTKIATRIDAQLLRTDPSKTAERAKSRAPFVFMVVVVLCAVTLAALVFVLPARKPGIAAPVTTMPSAPELPVPTATALPEPAPVEVEPLPKDLPKVPARSDPATLRFFAKPWAKITVNEHVYGTTPLFNTVELQPGRYVVRFENPAYKTVEKRIELKGGDRREVHVTLEKP